MRGIEDAHQAELQQPAPQRDLGVDDAATRRSTDSQGLLAQDPRSVGQRDTNDLLVRRLRGSDHETVKVEGEHGGAVMAPVMRPTVRRDGSACMNIGTDWFARFAEAYRLEAAVWLESFSGPMAIGPSAWDGFEAERVVEAAIESLLTRQPVDVAPVEVPGLYRP